MKTVAVYKTDVPDESKARSILYEIRQELPGSDPSFDLEDCDKVLRVESPTDPVDEARIEKIVNKFGCHLQILPL